MIGISDPSEQEDSGHIIPFSWTVHKLSNDARSNMILPIATILSSTSLLLVYALCCAVYRRLKQRHTHNKPNPSINEKNEDQHPKNPIGHHDPVSRTRFELATGTQLQAQFGVVVHFESYKCIKGMKYASADGLYTNGFVIVNSKFLIAIVPPRFYNIGFEICISSW